jgi:hypothetical protein
VPVSNNDVFFPSDEHDEHYPKPAGSPVGSDGKISSGGVQLASFEGLLSGPTGGQEHHCS